MTPIGKWFVKKGNTVEGDYSQSVIEEETPEGDKKTRIKVTWKTAADIVKAAESANAADDFS